MNSQLPLKSLIDRQSGVEEGDLTLETRPVACMFVIKKERQQTIEIIEISDSNLNCIKTMVTMVFGKIFSSSRDGHGGTSSAAEIRTSFAMIYLTWLTYEMSSDVGMTFISSRLFL